MNYNYQKYKIITNKDFGSNYPVLHASLNKNYPVGLKSSNEKYKSFVGFKALEQIITLRIQDQNNYSKRWTEGFLNKLSGLTAYEVKGATFGLCPNYGGEIILEQSKDLRYTKKLLFFVSLINNYFSIQIIHTDKFVTFQRENLPDITGYGILEVIVSPTHKYRELFLKMERLIKEKFYNARFIPFRFDITKLENFEVYYNHSHDFKDPISSAFFNKGKLLNGDTEIIGDLDYKIDELV